MNELETFVSNVVRTIAHVGILRADNGLEIPVIKFFTEFPEGSNDPLKLAVHQAILKHYYN